MSEPGTDRRAALVEEELVASVAWFIRLRWLAGLGVLAASAIVDFVLEISIPVLPLYLIGIAILAYNALCFFILRRFSREARRDPRGFGALTQLQIALDWLAMTALIHFSGGLESPAVLYFFFHIIIASVLLPVRATYRWAALASLLFGGTAALEYVGILPHVHVREFVDTELYRVPFYIFAKLFFFVTTMFVAAYLASTLNARLWKRAKQVVELRDQLQVAYNRLEMLYGTMQAVNSTLELQQVLDRLVRATTEAMNVRGCSIYLLDETRTRLRAAAVYGLSQAYIQKGDLVLERNPLAREVLAGKTLAVGDITADTRLQYPAQAIAEGIRSMLSAPLVGKRGAIGLIRAYCVKPNRFAAGTETFLTAMASQGSIAIENALAYQTLGQLDQMKSKFVLTVTHELRSPVGVVRSLLRTMAAGYTGGLNDQQRDIVARVQHRADFLQTLIDDLLDLAAGKSELSVAEEQVQVRLDKAVEGVVERFQVPAREKQIALEWRCDCDDAPVMVLATEEGIDRVLNNLVSNAIKYTPVGGRVSVVLRRGEQRAALRVSDTGIGIPEEARAHLFEEFYRAPNAKAIEKEGTGLGLAITKDLVTRYGGEIAVESEAGKGTTFVVTLPTVA